MDKKETLATLYSLRAGLSLISVENDKVKKEENSIDSLEANRNYLNEEVANKEELIQNQKNLIADEDKRIKGIIDKEYKKKIEEYDDKKRDFGYFDVDFAKKVIIWLVIIGVVVVLLGVGVYYLGDFFYTNAIEEGHGSAIDNAQQKTGEVMRDIVGPFMMKWGAIVFVGLIVLVLLYILIKYLIYKNHESRVARFNRGVERDKEYFTSQKNSFYKQRYENLAVSKLNGLNNKLVSLENNLVTISKENEEKFTLLDIKKDTHQNNILSISYRANSIYEALEKEYGDFLDTRDWANLDLVIYYLEAKRADTLKEALILLENRMQFEDLKSLIVNATNAIGQTINNQTKVLGEYLNVCFKNLSNLITEQNAIVLRTVEGFVEQTNSRLDSISRNVSALSNEVADLRATSNAQLAATQSIITSQQLTNSLLNKINTSSSALVSDCNYLRNIVENYEIRRRNNI